jgi:hypothetical protein
VVNQPYAAALFMCATANSVMNSVWTPSSARSRWGPRHVESS